MSTKFTRKTSVAIALSPDQVGRFFLVLMFGLALLACMHVQIVFHG